MEGKAEGRNVSMYERDWKIVERFGETLGLDRSSALRAIVRQWYELRSNAAPDSRPVIPIGSLENQE